MRLAVAAFALLLGATAGARAPEALHQALTALEGEGKFSGAVVVRDAEGIRFARGYGFADPFTGRRFTPDTPVDSASLAKPVTAAAVLMLARDGRIDLDAPVRRYLGEYPHSGTTVRQLLAHSAGLPLDESVEGLAGKTNAELLAASRRLDPPFQPGTAFAYCNLCSITLALLIERVAGEHYLSFVRERLGLPASVTIRPARLADWHGRAIGHVRTAEGKLERGDSYEGEAFYGAANFSISALQLAEWGAKWFEEPLRWIRDAASTPALIAGKPSGLTWGNWYCATGGLRCHYLGHHEGFHHMLYWDADRRVSIAMVSNNSLDPALQQRLQRAIVAFDEGRSADAHRELSEPLTDAPVPPGRFLLTTGEAITLSAGGERVTIQRRGIDYRAYLIGSGIRYVPGLDVYIAGATGGRLHWLSLYEDHVAAAEAQRR